MVALRILKWVLILAVVLALVGFVLLPALANTEAGRKELARSLSEAFDRPVTVGRLKVGWFYSSLDVGDLVIGNPEGFPDTPFLEADTIAFDADLRAILGGKVTGRLRGEGLRVHVVKKDGRSNLEGFGGDDDDDAGPAERGEGELDVGLVIEDSRLVIEDLDKGDKVVLDGVGLEMRLTNDADAGAATLRIRIDAIDNDALPMRDLVLDARAASDERLVVDKLSAVLPGEGTLSGKGSLQVHGGDAWEVELTADRVALGEDVAPLAASVFPFAANAGGLLDGALAATCTLRGNGLSWDRMKRTLAGGAEVRLADLKLPRKSLLAQIAAFTGRAEGDVALNEAGATFEIADGWMNFQRLSASGQEVRYDLSGRVSLAGALDLRMDLLPLVKQFGGGKVPKEIRQLDELPIEIKGTTARPDWKLPVDELLKKVARKEIEDRVGDKIGGILDKIGGKKKDD